MPQIDKLTFMTTFISVCVIYFCIYFDIVVDSLYLVMSRIKNQYKYNYLKMSNVLIYFKKIKFALLSVGF